MTVRLFSSLVVRLPSFPSALRKYNAYLIAHKYQRGEVFRRGDFLRLRPRKPQAFGISDTHISSFLARVQKAANLRDVALVTLLAHTGMKLQEALGLKEFDFDWHQGQVSVHAGGRKKARTIPLPEPARAALQAYREVRRTRYPQANLLAYFFAGQGRSTLTYSTVNRMFKKHSKTVTPKTLRQWFQADLLHRGATVAEVVHRTGVAAQTVSGLVQRQAEAMRKTINARQ